MPYEHLLVEAGGAVATITISRPAVLNALNAATLGELGRLMVMVPPAPTSANSRR
jgi:enoyl-CoA hydratase/carnithine racemase